MTLLMNNDRGTHDPVEQARVMEYLRQYSSDADIADGLPWTEEEIAALADADRQMREREREQEQARERAEREREAAASRAGNPDKDPGNSGSPGEWVRIEAVLTNEDAMALNDAAQLVAAESGDLASDRKVKLGQVIAALAAEYLGAPRPPG